MSKLDAVAAKIKDLNTLCTQRRVWESHGHKVVFTNGVFDIVHKGHITMLARAADYGDKLIVAINADVSVRSLGKGSDRPINAELDRAMVIAGMQMVDAVVVFDDATPLRLIQALLPDVLVKGGDYNVAQHDKSAKDYLVGSDVQRANGKETIVIPLVNGYSSTSIIEKSKGGKN